MYDLWPGFLQESFLSLPYPSETGLVTRKTPASIFDALLLTAVKPHRLSSCVLHLGKVIRNSSLCSLFCIQQEISAQPNHLTTEKAQSQSASLAQSSHFGLAGGGSPLKHHLCKELRFPHSRGGVQGSISLDI